MNINRIEVSKFFTGMLLNTQERAYVVSSIMDYGVVYLREVDQPYGELYAGFYTTLKSGKTLIVNITATGGA